MSGWLHEFLDSDRRIGATMCGHTALVKECI